MPIHPPVPTALTAATPRIPHGGCVADRVAHSVTFDRPRAVGTTMHREFHGQSVNVCDLPRRVSPGGGRGGGGRRETVTMM
jgi:hypothetical protein